jgi:hypothetical protein
LGDTGGKSNLRGWLIVVGVALLFLVWGLFIYFAIGDKGPPPWDFNVVKDIPGQSPVSTEPKGAAGPFPQHVDR